MIQKGLIVFLGVIGTLVLVNLFIPILKISSSATSSFYPAICTLDSLCSSMSIYSGGDSDGLIALYYLIYIPLMILFSLLLLPIFYEEVGHTFRRIILIISGSNTILILKVLIPGIVFLWSVDLLTGGLGVLFLNLFLFSLRLFPFLFNLKLFVSFHKKEPLEEGEYYLYPKYYPE